MKTSLFIFMAVVLMGIALSGGQAVSAAGGGQAGPAASRAGTDQLLVWFDAPAGAAAVGGDETQPNLEPAGLQMLASQLSAQTGTNLSYAHAHGEDGHVLKLEKTLPADAVKDLAARLAEQPGVSRVEPDWILQPAALPPPADEYWGKLWGLRPYSSSAGVVSNAGIDVQAAWEITTGSPSIVIAVIDTGILKQHPDLMDRYVGGYDMIAELLTANDGDGRDADASDPGDGCFNIDNSSWHGSHVAGTIAAEANNSTGVTGINWNSKILPVRAMGCGGGYTSDIIDAIRWSVGLHVPGVPVNPVANRAKVINLSLGGQEACSWLMQEAINGARATGAVVVVAAGNSGVDAGSFSPAACNGVITVGASNLRGGKTSYSNFGAVVEISAPGGEYDSSFSNPYEGMILSTVWDTLWNEPAYGWAIGTSMAAPHVAGVLSLMFSINPELSIDEAARIVQYTASPFAASATCGKTQQCGSGIINAGRAVAEASMQRWVQSPSPYLKAFAGDAAAPQPITVVTSPPQTNTPTAVTIGGVQATVISAVPLYGREYLTVQPPVMAANGLYNLAVTLDNVTYSQPMSVFFGRRNFLPSVSR